MSVPKLRRGGYLGVSRYALAGDSGRILTGSSDGGKRKDTVRVKIQRTNEHGLQSLIADLNRTLKDWFE